MNANDGTEAQDEAAKLSSQIHQDLAQAGERVLTATKKQVIDKVDANPNLSPKAVNYLKRKIETDIKIV